MILTDTHTHLYASQFDKDREQMIQRALDIGVKRFFIPAIDSETTQVMYDLENKYKDNVFLMMGLHPTHVNESVLEELNHVKEQLDTRKFYAVGEIGIDLYWDKTFLQQQQDAFKQQILWAKEKKLPIAIHCRDAFDEIFEILEEQKGKDLYGIFHCFTGTAQQAHQVLNYNMKLGIGGVATFKNGKIDTFLKNIPLEHIVLETDAPYLAPTPFRGKRNESAFLINIADKLAEIYQKPINEIAKITTQNSKNVFGI